MEVILWKKPKEVTLIEGFPGFGLVGTIVTEFLLDHLSMELIGKVLIDESPAVVAIHQERLVEPLGIFYNKQYNIVVVHAVAPSTGIEWKVARVIHQLATDLETKEIVSIEGVGSAATASDTDRLFYFSPYEALQKRLTKIGVHPLKEGIIMGVTGALLLTNKKTPMSCIFAETHTDLPDSKAAARVIRALDSYLGLDVDPKPLLEQAQQFEAKIKDIMQKGQEAVEMSDAKRMSYVG